MNRLGRDNLFYKIIDKENLSALSIIDDIVNINFQDKNGYSY